MSWEQIFALDGSVWEPILRGSIMYVVVFALMRILGRRESGELNTSDLILVLLISEAASVGLAGEYHSIADSTVVVVTILAWSLLFDALGYNSKFAAKLLKPAPRPLIKNGIVNIQTARRELMTRSEIRSEMRKKGIADISTVYLAFVEPDGTISVLEAPDSDTDSKAIA